MAAYLEVGLLLLCALSHDNLLLSTSTRLHNSLNKLAWLACLHHDRCSGSHSLGHDSAPLNHSLSHNLSRGVHDPLLHHLALLVQGDHVAWADLFDNLALLVHLHHLLALRVHLNNLLLALLVHLHHLLSLGIQLHHLSTLHHLTSSC